MKKIDKNFVLAIAIYFGVAFYIEIKQLLWQIINFMGNSKGEVFQLIGILVGFYGVYWQTTRSEKQQEKKEKLGLLKALNYPLAKNLKEKDWFYAAFGILYYKLELISLDDVETLIEPIPKGLINDNFKILFNLKDDLGEKIYNLDKDINRYNSKFYFLIKNKKTMETILKSVKENKEESKEGLNKILEERMDKIKKIFKDGKEILDCFLAKQGENTENLKVETEKNLNDLFEINLKKIFHKKHLLNLSEKNRIIFDKIILSEINLLRKDDNVFSILDRMEEVSKEIDKQIKELEK